MIELTGNLWDWDADATVITTNGSVRRDGYAVMGRGVARQAAIRYPNLPLRLGHMIAAVGNHVVMFGGYDRWIITFPVKLNWNEPAIPELIARSCTELVKQIDSLPGWENIVLPRPGCGNGHLQWSDVRPILQAQLDDRFLVTHEEGHY